MAAADGAVDRLLHFLLDGRHGDRIAATSMRSAGSGTKLSSGITDSTASTARADETPAIRIGAPVTVEVAVEAAGKFASTMAISSPWPILRSANNRSASNSGSIPHSMIASPTCSFIEPRQNIVTLWLLKGDCLLTYQTPVASSSQPPDRVPLAELSEIWGLAQCIFSSTAHVNWLENPMDK